MLLSEELEKSLFSRKYLSDKCSRLGTHNLEVETSCIKQAKEKLFDHHLARLERLLEKRKSSNKSSGKGRGSSN